MTPQSWLSGLVLLLIGNSLITTCDSAVDQDGDSWYPCMEPNDTSQTCDCNDLDAAISPDGIEIDNQIDDDCDGIPEWLSSESGGLPSWGLAQGPAQEPIELPDQTVAVQYNTDYVHFAVDGEVIPPAQGRIDDAAECTCLHMVLAGQDRLACLGLSYDEAGVRWGCLEIRDVELNLLTRYDRLLKDVSKVTGIAYMPNGDFLVASGGYIPESRTDSDAFVLKLTSDFKRDWIFEGGQVGVFETMYGVAVATDNTIVASGFNLAADPDAGTWIIKLDTHGKLVWERTSKSARQIFTSDVITAPNGGVLITGYISNTSVTPYAVRLGVDGSVLWDWAPDDSVTGEFRGGVLDSTGSFVLAAAYGQNYHAVFLSDDGLFVSDRNVNVQGEAFGLVQLGTGGYLITGWYKDPKFSNAYAHVMRVDEQFNTPPGDYYGETGWFEYDQEVR